MSDPLRVYVPGADEFATDGYPVAWHATIKQLVREQAGHRCVRCGHPYQCGEQGNGEWSACDERCTHGGPIRGAWVDRKTGEHCHGDEWSPGDGATAGELHREWGCEGGIQARWRILTVHHLTGDKADCRWWNLIAACQRCHLWLQRRVVMDQVWPFEHDDYFKPYAAGFYAAKYLGEDLTRKQTMARLDELLSLERVA